AWRRFARRWLDPARFEADDKETLAKARTVYAKRIGVVSRKLAESLDLEVKNMTWEPANAEETLSDFERDLRWLDAKADYAFIVMIREKKLDSVLGRLIDLNREQL